MSRVPHDEKVQEGLRGWSEPRVERLHIGATASGTESADEDLLPQTAPPS